MIKRAFRRIEREFRETFVHPRIVQGKQKIFCIGRNKTGTTSLAIAFKELGYIVGNQRKAELLLDNYIDGDFDAIIRYCSAGQVFQDVPFSYPGLYKYLDKAYPGSKFILSIRDNTEQWYNSLIKFHGKMFGKGNIPTAEDLRSAKYVYKGWIWKAHCKIYSTPYDDPYNKEMLIQHYLEYNEAVKNYFSGRDQLLIINLSEKGAYHKFCDFIGVKPTANDFPWENRTQEMKVKI